MLVPMSWHELAFQVLHVIHIWSGFWSPLFLGPCWYIFGLAIAGPCCLPRLAKAGLAYAGLPKSPWRRWMISPTGPTIWPAMINPCDDIPPNTNQCTVIMDDDGDHTHDPFTLQTRIMQRNNGVQNLLKLARSVRCLSETFILCHACFS